MLILLSPAKNLDFNPPPASAPAATKPLFLNEARSLANVARELSPAKLKKLMGVSDKLAELNHQRFMSFRGDGKSNSQKQAALAFNGDVYLGLDARTMSAEDLAFAQDRLRILSGLYGLLRPLDAIEPYRLEMGLSLKNPAGKNIYAWWNDRVAKEVDKAAKKAGDGVVVNLASNEYFSVIPGGSLKARIVTPVFREEKDGKLRTLQFFAKRARGMMARWAIDNRVDDVEKLKKFSRGGYKFRAGDSSQTQWLFTRPQPAPKGK